VDLLGSTEKISHVAQRQHSYIQRLARAGRIDPSVLHIVVNHQMPGHPLHHSIVVYLRRSSVEGKEQGPLIDRFVNGDDQYRNDTLKMIPRIVEGSWIVQKAAGTTPAIIGRKLTCTYFRDEKLNYVEVDIDVGSSVIGANLQGLVHKYTTTLVIDLTYVIQGNSEEELPEQLWGGLRIIRGDLAKCQVVPTAAEEAEALAKAKGGSSSSSSSSSTSSSTIS